MNSAFLIKVLIELLLALFISVTAFGQNMNPLEDDRNYKTNGEKTKKSNLVFKKVNLRIARNYKQSAQMDSVEAYQLVWPRGQSLKNRNYKNK